MTVFNPIEAARLAEDLEREHPPLGVHGAIARQLRAACAEVERLRSIVDRHNDEAIKQDETWCTDRDRLAARVAELERLAGEAASLTEEACDEAETSCPTCAPSEPGQAHIDEIRTRNEAIRAALKGGSK